MSGHKVYWPRIPLGVLSNGYFVACSGPKNQDKPGYLSIWKPSERKMIKTIPAVLCGACSLLLLANDTVAVGFISGAIKIFDLIDEELSYLLHKTQRGAVWSLLQLSCGFFSQRSLRKSSIRSEHRRATKDNTNQSH